MSHQQTTYLLPRLTGTIAGRIAIFGAVIQVPLMLLFVAKAYLRFPDEASTAFAGLALMHAAAAASALGCWFYYGVALRSEKSKFLYVLIGLVAIAPLFVSAATLRNG